MRKLCLTANANERSTFERTTSVHVARLAVALPMSLALVALAACGGGSDSGSVPVAHTGQVANAQSSDPPDASVAADTAQLTSPVSQAPVGKQTQVQVPVSHQANLMPARKPSGD